MHSSDTILRRLNYFSSMIILPFSCIAGFIFMTFVLLWLLALIEASYRS
jgi:hypothetical protein